MVSFRQIFQTFHDGRHIPRTGNLTIPSDSSDALPLLQKEERGRYNGRLRAGWPRGWNSSACRGKIFSSPCRADGFWGPPSLLSNGYRGIFPEGKRLGRVAVHSPPTSVEAQKTWIYISTPPIRLHGVALN
jgi:hypothetical protein